MFLSVFVLGSTGSASGLVDWFLIKRPASSLAPPVPGATGISPFRKFIIHEEKGIASTQDGTPMVFKGVIRIPKVYQRVGALDELELHIVSQFAAQFCIKAIYKSYR